ncbi:MAG TPA: DUF4956 domain-containing protein [Candidatus Sumerlaeota bacterium]|nr:DUF4956 domain-containing protein [Candidatus Sumerlaeota bacterium]
MKEILALGNFSGTPLGFADILGVFLTAFIQGQLVAWVYIYTHQGLSYSRAFVQSLVLLTMCVSLSMMVIGNNLAVAFGLIGALSVIRFRNVLKDTRDTAFIFISLTLGMATGTRIYTISIMGMFAIILVLLYLHWTSFGSRHTSDGFLRFTINKGEQTMSTVHALLNRYCRQAQLMSQRFQDNGFGEIAYRLVLRDPSRSDELVEQLESLSGVSKITFVLHEEQAEV